MDNQSRDQQACPLGSIVINQRDLSSKPDVQDCVEEGENSPESQENDAWMKNGGKDNNGKGNNINEPDGSLSLKDPQQYDQQRDEAPSYENRQ